MTKGGSSSAWSVLRAADAGAEQAVEEHVGAFDEGRERDEFIVILGAKDLAPVFDETLDQRVVFYFSFDAIGACPPACVRQLRQRNQRVAAVVAGTDQADHFFQVVVGS
jgi:hypothetical protein